MDMQAAIQQFDLVWFQSIPSISALYYHKYLSETHILHCPDHPQYDNQGTRSIARQIVDVIKNNEKRVAIYFLKPCSQVRRTDIFNFVLKKNPDLSVYCLTIPSTLLQSSLLLGWSAGLEDTEWKRRCAIHFSPEAFEIFSPPTQKSGQSACTEFSHPFVISNELFEKQALIVNLKDDMMVSLDIEKGIVFTEAAKNSILGWIDASTDQARSLVWIIDERILYGDIVHNVPQERRHQFLKNIRDITFESIQEFNSDIPIYTYIVDYFDINQFHLLNCLGQIQHRHGLCISKSIFLSWSIDETNDINQDYFGNMKFVHLNQKGTLNQSKWISLYQAYIKDQLEASKVDMLNYISPNTINITTSIEKYRIPLLSTSNTGELTREELINHSTRHCVSAKSLEIFNTWAKNIMKMESKPCPPQPTFKEPLPQSPELEQPEIKPAIDTKQSPLERFLASLTMETIGEYIKNTGYMDKAQSIQNGVQDLRILVDTPEQDKMTCKVQGPNDYNFFVTIYLNKTDDSQYEVGNSHCTCTLGKWGNCKHCAALLLYILSKPTHAKASISQKEPTSTRSSSPIPGPSIQHEVGYSSQNSQASSSKKRSYSASQDDQEAGSSESSNKKKSSSLESSSGTVTTVPYDPNSISSSSLNTDEEIRTSQSVQVSSTQYASFSSASSIPSLDTISPVASVAATIFSKSSSSQSQKSSSNSHITIPSLPSTSSYSSSLSDNQNLRRSLQSIEENTVEVEIHNDESVEYSLHHVSNVQVTTEVNVPTRNDTQESLANTLLASNDTQESLDETLEPLEDTLPARDHTEESLPDTLPVRDTTDDET